MVEDEQDAGEAPEPDTGRAAGAADAGAAGGLDLGGLLSQAMEMQGRLAGMQEAAAETVVEGRSGGGAVTIEVTGDLTFRSVTIDPAAVDPEDISLLEDMVLAALRDAMDQISEMSQSTMEQAGLGSLSALSEMMGLGDLGAVGGAGGAGMGVGSLAELGFPGLPGFLGEGNDADDDDEDEDEERSRTRSRTTSRRVMMPRAKAVPAEPCSSDPFKSSSMSWAGCRA